MNVATQLATEAPGETSWRSFFRHFLEMVLAMLVGMAVLGAAASGIFTLLGHSNLLHYAGLRALLMAGYMTIGMSLWMRHRGHGLSSVLEMAGAMFVPYVVLIGPYGAGLLSRGALIGGMHVLMLPAMLVVMLYRREEHSQDHRRQSPSHEPLAA